MPSGRIRFRGKSFQSPLDLYRSVRGRTKVALSTFMSRHSRVDPAQGVSDERLAEMLYWPAARYRRRHGSRVTWVEVEGSRMSLNEYFEKNSKGAAVGYRTLWQRVARLRRDGELSAASVEDAASLNRVEWRVFYGGGRARPLTYQGELFPEQIGKNFRSIAAFLLTVGRYANRRTLWSRLKANWDLDSAISEPVVTATERKGLIYCLTRVRTGEVYVGLTRLSAKARWLQHIDRAKTGGTSRLSEAIR